ncbi:hypothetical protein [Parasphingorhabdus halotolerans]|uniref:Uncharacterized protein n=1 Tax=Parasphingorhabdus halotolerans TaxID=2725558 RepID=A0A6H2DJW2_9SPHN|nr:hypothetical protein [Parasphingorhabdus halotolerans]QJB68427.1 hypothetical protein HF685_03170 [Parasphingorhabdus halotolerans]
MQYDQPLLVVAKLSTHFRISSLVKQLKSEGQATYAPQANNASEQCEVILDGMSFLLSRYAPAELNKGFEIDTLANSFCKKPVSDSSAIGIALGENIKSGKHVATINRALLKLAILTGDIVNATHVSWLPARHNIDFGFFVEAANDYIAGGPVPALIQVAVNKSSDGALHTTGLDYFCGQEVVFQAPPDFPENESIKRLVRIAHDLATNGPIDNAIETSGLDVDETIRFQPSGDSKHLSVEIIV